MRLAPGQLIYLRKTDTCIRSLCHIVLLEFRQPILLTLKKMTKNKSQNFNSLGDWEGSRPSRHLALRQWKFWLLTSFFLVKQYYGFLINRSPILTQASSASYQFLRRYIFKLRPGAWRTVTSPERKIW